MKRLLLCSLAAVAVLLALPVSADITPVIPLLAMDAAAVVPAASPVVIKPTVGRVVWYTPYASDDFPHQQGQPLAAMITCVWTDSCVNLVVFDANGNSHGRTSVLLVQEGAHRPVAGFCEWMPYQKGQAAKAEALQAKLSEKQGDAIPA